MLRKLKWQIPEEPLAARYNWCQGPVPGCGPAVEKHCHKVLGISSGIINARVRYRAAARRLRNTAVKGFLQKFRHYNLHHMLLSTNVGTQFTEVVLISNKSLRSKRVIFFSVQGQHAHDMWRLKAHMISRHIIQYNDVYASVSKLGTVIRPPFRQTNIHDNQNNHLNNKYLKAISLLICGPR